MRFIGLADCNNFFVSCERVFRPDLWEKPVVVLSPNDGAIVARSEEAKRFGIPMGVPYFKVRDLIETHGVRVFSSNFDLYRDMSRRVMDTLREALTEAYQYSIDEAFFWLEWSDEAEAIARLTAIKRLVERRVGVPMSFGLAPTMTIAKYASEREKRGRGVCLMTESDWRAAAGTIPLGDLWGVGSASAAKFREHSLYTVADLLAADRGRVDRLFGLSGARLRSEVNCVPAHDPARRTELPKSIMSTRSLGRPATSLAVLEDALAYHLAQVAEELRGYEAVAGRLSVLLQTGRHSEWVLRGGSAEAVLPNGTSDTIALLTEAKRLAATLYERGVPYRKVGVILGDLRPIAYAQPDLFAAEAAADRGPLMKIIDGINRTVGSNSVTIGRVRRSVGWQGKREHRSPEYTTKWSEVPHIR